MDIVVNEELKAYIDPMTPEEYEALERSILAEGCRDALVLWGNILVDGHHRYSVCRKHDLPFKTMQHAHFQSMDDVHLWMIDQHLGRRSVSPFQRGVLALRKREILAERRARARKAEEPAIQPAAEENTADDAVVESRAAVEVASAEPLNRETLAREARLSNSQIGLIEKIQKQATEEVVAAVKSGTLSINAAAAVATLPAEEQRAAAAAGEQELKQAAKRVREARRKPRDEAAAPQAANEDSELQQLRDRVTELTTENETLRRRVEALEGELAELRS
ncbi:plasmid replication/partition related protein [Dyella jiangningensis]|uniref:Plasmid replication/partition related protein n=1 Tax=Dyella jiangningensis TaxID=1379159 RepID=A0A328PEF7_9GAMM|nr:plasmid replication/partition related protein [Dyella jiangningensis]RAO78084.1 plasmid replication/partition related protein [Dyella jiangningensis]